MRDMRLLLSLLLLTAISAFPALAQDSTTNFNGSALGAPHEWGWFFQEGHNALNDEFISFHNYVFVIITGITVVVLGLMAYIAIRYNRKRNPNPSKVTHHVLLEIVWTIVPIILVIVIMVPSLKLLYHVDRAEKSDYTLKVTGYQWYWGYEYPELGIEEFESRMIADKDLKEGDLRLLEVDEPIYIPVGKTIKVLVTADPLGVIHAWGVQALAFKRDATPGRVNEGWLKIDKPGVYYGQCYELCGVDHAFMPIKVIAVSQEEFDEWVESKGGKSLATQEAEKAEAEKKAEEEAQKAPKQPAEKAAE